MGARRDYTDIRNEFVTSPAKVSFRELGAKYGVSFSFLAAKAKKEDWIGQREAYKAALARRTYEHAAVAVADENAAIQKESILVARAYIRKFGQQILDANFRTNAKDAATFMQLLINELAPPGETSGPKVIEGQAVTIGVGDPDLLRRVVEMARERVAPAGVLGPVALEQPPGARPN